MQLAQIIKPLRTFPGMFAPPFQAQTNPLVCKRVRIFRLHAALAASSAAERLQVFVYGTLPHSAVVPNNLHPRVSATSPVWGSSWRAGLSHVEWWLVVRRGLTGCKGQRDIMWHRVTDVRPD